MSAVPHKVLPSVRPSHPVLQVEHEKRQFRAWAARKGLGFLQPAASGISRRFQGSNWGQSFKQHTDSALAYGASNRTAPALGAWATLGGAKEFPSRVIPAMRNTARALLWPNLGRVANRARTGAVAYTAASAGKGAYDTYTGARDHVQDELGKLPGYMDNAQVPGSVEEKGKLAFRDLQGTIMRDAARNPLYYAGQGFQAKERKWGKWKNKLFSPLGSSLHHSGGDAANAIDRHTTSRPDLVGKSYDERLLTLHMDRLRSNPELGASYLSKSINDRR